MPLPPDLLAEAQANGMVPAGQLLAGPRRYSATFLGWAENCLLAMKRSKEVDNAGRAAVEGNAFHEVASTVSLKCKLEGRANVSAPEAREIADRVLTHPERPGPLARRVYERVVDMAGRWASVMRFDPEADFWEIEVPARNRLAEFTLSGRIDDVCIRGTHCKITDYKTGARLPNDEDYGEHTQIPIYAWHVLQEHPYIETFELTELFVRFGVPRTLTMSSWDVEALEPWLLALCRRIAVAYQQQEFPPRPGAHCAICPDVLACPLPREARPAALLGDEDAERVGERLLATRKLVKQDEAALRAYLDEHPEGAIYVNGQRLGYQPSQSSTLNKDRLALRLAGGGDVNPEAVLADFYDTTTTSKWSVRKARKGEQETN